MIYDHKFALTMMALLCGLFLYTHSSAADSRQGHSAYFGIGARAMALNGAFTAVSNDYTAPFWNPAAMDFFSTTKIGAMVNQMSLNRKLKYASAVAPTHRWGAFAISWSGFAVEGIEARTNNTWQPDRLFDYNENSFYFCYAYRFLPFLSLGANFKIFHFQILEATANGIGIDVALLFALSQKARIGFVTQDLNSRLKWSSGTQEKFIPNYRFGFAVEPFANILLTADYHYANDGQSRISFASEVIAMNVFKIRCGIAQDRFTAGIGATFQAKGLFLNLNYAVATDQFGLGVSDGFDMSLVF